MNRIEVDWFITHEGKPLVRVTGLRSTLALPPAIARAVAIEILKSAEESEQPDAAQVSAERAP